MDPYRNFEKISPLKVLYLINESIEKFVLTPTYFRLPGIISRSEQLSITTKYEPLAERIHSQYKRQEDAVL